MLGLGKVKCNSCGTENESGSKFCSDCGNSISVSVCSNCGTEIEPNAKFCPNCGLNIKETPADDRSKANPIPVQEKIKMWSRGPDDFARRFEIDDIKGTFKKHISVEQGTRAIFLQGGKFTGELIAGTYDGGGLLKKIENLNFAEKATVILVDVSDTRLKFDIGELRTKESIEAGVNGILSVNIENPILFFTNMMKGRENISTSELSDYLKPEMTNLVQTKIKQYSLDDLYGNPEIKGELQQDFEHQMKTTLDQLGMKLTQLVSFDYDESKWSDLISEKGGVGLDERKEDLEDARLGLEKRGRARATDSEIDKLTNGEEINDYLHDLEKRGIIRNHDKIELQRVLQENLQDLQLVRKQIREKLAQTHDINLEKEKVDSDIEIGRKKAGFTDETERIKMARDKEEAFQGIDILKTMKAAKREDAAGLQEIEEAKLKARSNATDESLISVVGEGDGSNPALGHLSELAKMKAAKGLTEEQILAMQAKDSAGVAKAFEAKFSSEKTEQLYRERMDDHQKFQDTMMQMSDKSADRAERMASKSMEQMGATAVTRGQAAVPTTTVVGGGGISSSPVIVGGGGNPLAQEKKIIICQGCNAENEIGTSFCTTCGQKI